MILSPSILSADFFNLERQLRQIQEQVQWLHLDVMDGHFVPNISIGIPVVRSLKKNTSFFLDVHLMISNPDQYIKQFADSGADLLCFHLEAQGDPLHTIQLIHDCGKKAGLAVNPDTDLQQLIPLLPSLDMVLIMSVFPGFGGQVFIEESLNRIQLLHALKMQYHPELLIQVDGGINEQTGRQCIQAGADVLVAGSYIFDNENPSNAIRSLCS